MSATDQPIRTTSSHPTSWLFQVRCIDHNPSVGSASTICGIAPSITDTRDAAVREVFIQFVKDHWAHVMKGQPMPTDRTDAVIALCAHAPDTIRVSIEPIHTFPDGTTTPSEGRKGLTSKPVRVLTGRPLVMDADLLRGHVDTMIAAGVLPDTAADVLHTMSDETIVLYLNEHIDPAWRYQVCMDALNAITAG